GQATEAHLGVTKLALDHPEWMFDLGTYLRLGLLDFALGLVQRAALAQLLVSAAPRRNLPDDRAACMLGTLLDAGIAGIAADQVLVAVQQLVHLGDIGHVGRRAHHAVYQAGFAVGADVRLHAEVVSRPRELPPQPLAEPYVTLSRHTAPVIQPCCPVTRQ